MHFLASIRRRKTQLVKKLSRRTKRPSTATPIDQADKAPSQPTTRIPREIDGKPAISGPVPGSFEGHIIAPCYNLIKDPSPTKEVRPSTTPSIPESHCSKSPTRPVYEMPLSCHPPYQLSWLELPHFDSDSETLAGSLDVELSTASSTVVGREQTLPSQSSSCIETTSPTSLHLDADESQATVNNTSGISSSDINTTDPSSVGNTLIRRQPTKSLRERRGMRPMGRIQLSSRHQKPRIDILAELFTKIKETMNSFAPGMLSKPLNASKNH